MCNPGLCQNYTGSANDIGAGVFGVFVIGVGSGIQPDNDIFEYNEEEGGWNQISGKGRNLAVGPNSLFVANDWGALWKWNSTHWEHVPNVNVQDVGVGADETLCYTGKPVPTATSKAKPSSSSPPSSANGSVNCQRGSEAITYAGMAIHVDVTSSGNPVVVNQEGNVFEWEETTGWEERYRPFGVGMADVAVTHADPLDRLYMGSWKDGVVYVYDYDNEFHDAGTGISTAMRIATDSHGNVWFIESDKSIHSFLISDISLN